MQTALRYGFLALGILLLGACGSAPPYQYENNDTLALESISTDGNAVEDLYEYPQLTSMEDDGGMDALPESGSYYEPPPAPRVAINEDFSPAWQSDDISVMRDNGSRAPRPQVSAAAYSGSIEGGSDITATAQAYLNALYRGDGETAWRYAFVPYNPRQSWWDERTAKGALLMKAGSNEYFAGEKQGVRQIQIAPQSVRQQGNDASLDACASAPPTEDELAVGAKAEKFMQSLIKDEKGLEKQTIADIAFLDGNTANSKEGQKRLRKAVQMMGQFLRQTFSEAGIDSNKAVFTAKKMQSSEINDVDQVLVVLHAYEPDSSRVVNGTALITRWRKTDNGWKLDMNPYLDNFRSSRK